MIRFHRAAGLIVVALVAAHVLFVIGGEDDYGSWINPLDAPLPVAWAWWLALLIVLTFTALWRRVMRIPYEAWRGLHIAFGLGALAFAFGHVIAISRFTETGTIRWLTLGFVIAALVAAFYLRVARQFIAPVALTACPAREPRPTDPSASNSRPTGTTGLHSPRGNSPGSSTPARRTPSPSTRSPTRPRRWTRRGPASPSSPPGTSPASFRI